MAESMSSDESLIQLATADDERWPEFSAAALEAGIRSTLSLPLVVGGDGLGALNIYCHEPSGFTSADEVLGASFASYASVALANARMSALEPRAATEPASRRSAGNPGRRKLALRVELAQLEQPAHPRAG